MRKRTCSLLLVVAGCWFWLLAARAAAQENWTRFRGPNGTGVVPQAERVPVRWSEKDYLWQTTLPGGGHSSPVFWQGRVFLTCADDTKTAQRIVVCLDAETGRILWQRHFASQPHRKHRFNSFASSTPAVDEKHVYVCWSTPQQYLVLALTHEGREVWRRDLGPFVSQHSSGVSPIVYNRLVVLPVFQDAEGGGRSFIVALDRNTGQTRWRLDRKSTRVAYSTPCVYRTPEGKELLIFNSQSHGVTAVDPESGSVVWELSQVDGKPLLNKRSVSSPIVVRGLVFASCGSGGGGNYVVAVRPPGQGRTEPELAFKIDRAAPYVPTPVAKDDLVFLWYDRGIVTCVEVPSGRVVWRKRVGGNFFGSPICVGDRLYCLSTDGECVVLHAGRRYKLLARNPVGELSHATPAVYRGRLYLRTYTHLICLEKE